MSDGSRGGRYLFFTFSYFLLFESSENRVHEISSKVRQCVRRVDDAWEASGGDGGLNFGIFTSENAMHPKGCGGYLNASRVPPTFLIYFDVFLVTLGPLSDHF